MGKHKLIFLPPPFTSTYYTYQDVNADPTLRKKVTDHFFDLINKNKTKNTNFLSSRDGYELVYKILRRFTKKYDLNWYDLRNMENTTMEYINIKINKILK
ncbi:hypothetical protein crov487 [Cafeteria roenbergensis virus]|uniref:Uncharacterized protein n=1 Tax=Cafeteria roenbergensis virus (strain BV-PW1) TaxID=693272 RepID=E3T5Q8_CROVB|nr:hypothetical protein crov487 [Cafeteria roenbergensis virus BV-PW1]ADO67521.1 hypothetical protein crov487 [Cafeteria roenbergensis virus BV-PW1]